MEADAANISTQPSVPNGVQHESSFEASADEDMAQAVRAPRVRLADLY